MSLRREIFDRDEWTCQYCGVVDPEEGLHLEHVIPVSRGGPTEAWNLVAACPTCNLTKGAKILPTRECPIPFRIGRYGYTPAYRFWRLCKQYPELVDGFDEILSVSNLYENQRWRAWSCVKVALKPYFDSVDDYDDAIRNLSCWMGDDVEDLNDYETNDGIKEIAA